MVQTVELYIMGKCSYRLGCLIQAHTYVNIDQVNVYTHKYLIYLVSGLKCQKANLLICSYSY